MDFGKIFSDESLLEILNSCIPPTFIIGIRVIAITIIPIPPSHCKIALHKRILLGVFSKFEIIVEPVVVIPDILSKNASLKESCKLDKTNGTLPKNAILIHAIEENKNACFRLSCFSLVRFGNVLNTNGSVLHIFKQQIDNNIPLTITSEDMSRFFISLSQAIDLCLYAAENMSGGEIYVKNMGSCNIMSLAKAVSSGKKFDYEVIGSKPGEKAYEELVTEVEAKRTVKKKRSDCIKNKSNMISVFYLLAANHFTKTKNGRSFCIQKKL